MNVHYEAQFHYCSVNVIVKRSEIKAKRSFKYDHNFKFDNWNYWIHIQRNRMSNVNMSVLNIIFEGNFRTNVFATVCFWHFRQLKRVCWTSRQLFFEKVLNFFVCVEVLHLYKSEIYMKLTFSRGHYCKHAYWKRLLCA